MLVQSLLTPFLSLNCRLWPFYMSFSVFSLAICVVLWFHFKVSTGLFLFCLFIVAFLRFI